MITELNAANIAESLVQQLGTVLPSPLWKALQACEALCAEQDTPLYLVGGALRDLLLQRPGFDLDLAVESDDVAALASELARRLNGRAVTHDRFGTAGVTGEGFRLDLARTRREAYPHPGVLPQVEPAGVVQDLARRDFTINAVALRLWPKPDTLIDPYRGVEDTRSALIRVLHEASFRDDATRILRAVRYAARLEFKIATQTETLLRHSLTYLDTISGPRLRRELMLIFEEPAAPRACLLAQRLGVLTALHRSFHLEPAVAERWQIALQGEPYAPLDELGFCLLADVRDEDGVAAVTRWLHLHGRIEHCLRGLVRLRAQSPKLAVSSPPSDIVAVLEGAPVAVVWALGLRLGGEVQQVCQAYLTGWRHIRPSLRGDDLLALGVAPGPSVGRVLNSLRKARLDGQIETREQEIEHVRGAVSDDGKGTA